MTGKEFLNGLANSKSDIIQLFLGAIADTDSRYCLIGGLAVNAYVEPVVSLDVDIVVAVDDLQAICRTGQERGLKAAQFEHGINLGSPHSQLRIQLQTDPRYQSFIQRAEERDVLGYRMRVAALRDVLQGKVWAYLDKTRRGSKRQKDLADILRIAEAYPDLLRDLPPDLRVDLDLS